MRFVDNIFVITPMHWDSLNIMSNINDILRSDYIFSNIWASILKRIFHIQQKLRLKYNIIQLKLIETEWGKYAWVNQAIIDYYDGMDK